MRFIFSGANSAESIMRAPNPEAVSKRTIGAKAITMRHKTALRTLPLPMVLPQLAALSQSQTGLAPEPIGYGRKLGVDLLGGN